MSRGNNRNGNNNSGGGRKRKKGRKKPKMDPVKYWGDPTALPVRNDYELEAVDPTATIRSLGKAPIPGKNSAPELYFEVLYKRAAGLAQALAFAGGLNESDAPTPASASSTNGASDANGSDGDANGTAADNGDANDADTDSSETNDGNSGTGAADSER